MLKIEFPRLMNLPKNGSFFLFGARGTGKSTYLRKHFQGRQTLWFDLLDPSLEEKLSMHPEEFKAGILAHHKKGLWVVVDEIQKCPKLLNLVHQLIESHQIRFALTGSSARRLKQKGVNLLAGRAAVRNCFPLTSNELGTRFDLRSALEWGTLPKVATAQDRQTKEDYLRAYALTYVEQEIRAEQWVRKLDPFRRFLRVAAQMNGKIVNYSNIAADVGADLTTVQAYFEILQDTLIALELPAYHRSVRKQQRHAPKFYFFDPGVKRALDQTLDVPLRPRTSAFGEAFEHWVILEIFRALSYQNKDFSLSYLRTKDDAEIDLIVERPSKPTLLIEIKSKDRITPKDATALTRFLKDFRHSQALLLSLDRIPKRFGDVQAVYWEELMPSLKHWNISPVTAPPVSTRSASCD